MAAARETGLDPQTPFVIMDWSYEWVHFENKWYELFPIETYGQTVFETHFYDFKDTVEQEEKAWNRFIWPSLLPITNSEVPVFVGEYTLALGKDLPADEAQGWAQYMQDKI